MAYFDHSLHSERNTVVSRLARLFETPFDRRNRRLAARVAELRALSDQDLAALGIARDQILFHVFGGKSR